MKKSKTYTVASPSKNIVEVLIDLERYGKIHPLIVKVEKFDTINTYRIFEKPFSWVPLNIQYTAAVKSEMDKISYTISGIPFARVYINYTLIQVSNKSTKANFHLSIESKMIGMQILQYKMMRAQDQFMTALQSEIGQVS